MERSAPSVRPPVALGCIAAVAAVAAIILFGALFLVFLDSGADDGKVVLSDPRAYGLGTIQYNSDHNFYLIRLSDGDFLALSDLDAANRANQQRRCRAAPLGASDPALAAVIQQYATKVSPAAAGSTVFFRESCNLAVYDLTGQRLDGDGPNLDRLRVGANAQGMLTVDVTQRSCTERDGAELFAPIPCP
jgi:hypothetical protein